MKPIEVVALRGKVYSIKTRGLDKTAYKETLLGDGSGRPPQDRYINPTTIRSEAHQVSTIRQNNVSLSALDQKRYVLWDSIHTYPFGHTNIIHDERYEDTL